MTGEKDRYKTHEQLWKLEDGELSTPKHDELVLQLLYKKNAIELFKKVHYMINHKDINVDPEFIENEITVLSELPIKPDNFIIGYIDIKIIRKPLFKDMTYNVYVEVKPSIKSFGETLRQVNTYKRYIHHDKNDYFVIYSPDERFKAAFESQGIQLVTPSDLGINS